jgi:hypothetical protein
MSCSSGCPTPGRHESFGACVRAKHLEIADVQAHKFNQSISKQQNAYVDARRAGLQPANVFKKDVDKAWAETERTGVPYRADK